MFQSLTTVESMLIIHVLHVFQFYKNKNILLKRKKTATTVYTITANSNVFNRFYKMYIIHVHRVDNNYNHKLN